jgi:hypothetical protein
MIWSYSAARMFLQCQRRWFFKNKLASATARDPLRREAYVLSKLQNLRSWRGNVVDATLSETLIRDINRGAQVTLSRLIHHAKQRFDADLRRAISADEADPIGAIRDGRIMFWQEAYGQGLTQQDRDSAWSDVENALRSIYSLVTVRTTLKAAANIITQRPLQFRIGTISIRAVPDAVAFATGLPPTIIDWKVQSGRGRDYRLQLTLYAVALTRAVPHRDFPAGFGGYEPSAIRLIEAQLLRNVECEYSVTEDDVLELEDFVASIGTQMQLASASESLTADEFETARWPNLCETCEFKKMCWREPNETTDERVPDHEPKRFQAALSFGPSIGASA